MKISKYKNSHLLINFGENKEVTELLKKEKNSIGINSHFADVNFDLFKAMRKEIKIDHLHVLDFDTINSALSYYSEYIEQLTRWNISDKNFPDPRHLYDDFLNSLNYWYNFIKYFNVEKIFIYEDPHRAYDLLIYSLAKQLKIKIFIFSELVTGYRTFIKENIEDNLCDVKGNFTSADKSLSNNLMYNHIYSQYKKQTIIQKVIYFTKLFFKIFSIKSILKQFRSFDSYLYNGRRSFIKLKPAQYWIWKYKAIVKTIIYKFHHKKHIKSVELSDNDIVFFLHYEPERTSNPLSGNARNQLYCIRMLKKSFPEKKIFVKEHPSQLNLKSKHGNRQFRDKMFLDQITLNSDGIIDKISNNSKFILATLNGTAGLEYAIKGHNVLCFGSAWYSFLQNVFLIKSHEDLTSIKFKEYDPQSIIKKLDETLYLKSAKGSVTNKLEKTDPTKFVESKQKELLDYVKWYFNGIDNK